MYTVIETPQFIATAKEIWTDAERMDFVCWVAENPETGPVIPASGGLRKVRWSRSGMGKRSGARVIYFFRSSRGEVVLITAYQKGDIENIPAHLLRKLVEKYCGNQDE